MANFKDIRNVPKIPYVSSANVLAIVEGSLVQLQLGAISGGTVPPELANKVTQLELGQAVTNQLVNQHTTQLGNIGSQITQIVSTVNNTTTALQGTNSALSTLTQELEPIPARLTQLTNQANQNTLALTSLTPVVTGNTNSISSNTSRIVSLEARPTGGTGSSLIPTGVTPGTYQFSTLDINQYGLVTNSVVLPDTDMLHPKKHKQQIADLQQANQAITTSLQDKISNTDVRLGDARETKGVAGGDLTGTYPNPVLKDTSVTPGTYQYATVSIDKKGRVTQASSNVPNISLGVVLIASRDAEWYYPSTGFTTIPLVASYDYLNRMNGSTFYIPRTGLYTFTSKVRVKDGEPYRGIGQGVNNITTDGAFFLWGSTTRDLDTNRNGLLNTRIALFNEGEPITLYMYCDTPLIISAAELTIVHMGSPT